MLLPLLIFTPFIGGILCCLNMKFSRFIAIISMILTMIESFWLLLKVNSLSKEISLWKMEFVCSWIPRFGINIHLALDGISLIMIILVNILGILSIIFSCKEQYNYPGLFYLNLLLVFSGIVGIFLSVDMFLFFFFWEVIIIPMYFLITLWGCKEISYMSRTESAIKYFIYSQLSSIFMLISILSLVYIHYTQTGNWTFNYKDLLVTNLYPGIELLLMIGFMLAFTVKMPIVPFHSWLPTIHRNSSIDGSVELLCLLIKTSFYGILRFLLPFFPVESHKYSNWAIYLGVISIFYGAFIAFTQTNLKKLVAYHNISHIGFLLLATFSRSYIAYQGLVINMISNTISSAGIILILGKIYKSINTFNIRSMGGLWKNIDYLPAMFLFFVVSSLGIPGTGNFLGEFLIFCGSYSKHPIAVKMSAFSIVLTSIYLIKIMHKMFFGPSKFSYPIYLSSKKDILLLIILPLLIVTLGFVPNVVLSIVNSAIKNIFYLSF